MRTSSTSVEVATYGRNGKGILARGGDALSAHPMVCVFVIALAVRMFIALVLANLFSASLVLDDSTYHTVAAQMAEGMSTVWDEYTYQLYWSTATFMIPVTFLYELSVLQSLSASCSWH